MLRPDVAIDHSHVSKLYFFLQWTLQNEIEEV